jgi:ABC-type transport system involved in multi-copper enzyme maturation permease subunit
VIWHVARRELLEHVRSARFLALCGLAVLLLPLSAHVNASQYRVRLAQAAELRSAQQRKIAERITQSGAYESLYGWRGGEVIADPALRAVRTPSRFAVLALGADESLPAYWQFSTEGLEAGPTAGAESTSGVGAEQMDAVFIVQSVLGLLALLLVFDAVSGERESGVLRLLLSAPVRRADLVLGKALGAVLTLAVPLVLGVAAALAVLEIEGMSLLRDGSFGRVAIFLAASALYLLHMVALGLAVSAITSRAKSSWVALLLAWIGLVLVIPRSAQMIAAATHPVAPGFEARQAKIAAVGQLQRDRARALAAAWREVSGSDSAPEEPVDRAVRVAYARAAASDERHLTARKRAAIRQVETTRQRALARRRRLAGAIAWLSPASSYAAVAANVAGTGGDAAQRWLDQVTTHQARLEAATFDRQFGMEIYPPQLGYLRIIWWPDLSDPSDLPPRYRDLPPFAFRDAPLAFVFAQSFSHLAVLMLGTVGWLVIALRAFQRAEVH